MKRKLTAGTISVIGYCYLFLLAGCGQDSADNSPSESPIPCDTLSAEVVIGEMMGDSSYVFGEIAAAVPTEGSGVAVLDIYGCDISFFDSTGTFIRSIGGRGDGPGEFLLPLDFAILEDGRIAVVDLVKRRIDILSNEGELLNSLNTDYAMLPFSMAAVSDSTFMIYYYSTRPGEGGFDMGFNLEIWNTSGLQDEIWSWRSEYTGTDFMFSPGYITCCGENGKVYYSSMDNRQFFIDYTDITDGGSGRITAEAESTEADSSDVGYIEPKVYVNYNVGDTPVDLESESLRYRPQIGAMGVDSQGRLWVRRGTSDAEDWLIFDESNEIVGTGTITGIPEEGRLNYVINRHGAVAWAPFTDEYPRIYLLSAD